MRLNFKKLLSMALTAVCILSSANVGTLAATKAGSVKQVKAWGGKKTYIEPPSFSGPDKKVPKTAQGVFGGDIVLDFGGNWTYKKGEKGSDKDQVFKPKEHYFPKLTITKIYDGKSTFLTKDNKKSNGYEEVHQDDGNYIRLWACFKDVTNDKVVQFKFHDGTGTFQDIITTIQKKGNSRYQLLSVKYQDPDGNAGGETGEQFTISFDYNGDYDQPKSQTVSKGGKVTDPELADVAYWYVKGNLNWKWDFSKSEVKGNRTLVAVLKKEIPVESEIWLCKPKEYEKTHVSVLYQYEDGKGYIQDLKESDKKKVIRTDKGKPNMFYFSMKLNTGEKEQRLNGKAYFSSEITIQRQDENDISIKKYEHLDKLCSVQFQNENGDLINSELPNFKIQERNNSVTTLTAPIRYIRKGNTITLAPELKEGYNWVKVESGNLTNQVFKIAQDTVDKNLVLRAVKKQDKTTFSVSFKSWDGKEQLANSQEVEEGKTIQAPSVQGIVAWYTKDSSEAATEYNFSDSTITSALVLYGAKGYTITLEDSEEKELGKVKVSDAEPKISTEKLKDLNTEDIEYWYVKGTNDPEKTENQITLADYSATEDVTLIGKKKPPVAEKEVPAIKSACIYPETDKVTIEYVAGSEYIGKITEVESTREEDENENLLEDTSSVSREGNKITISGDFEETLIYTIKAEGYKENQIAVEKEGDNDPAFIRDESSTGMTDLYSVKFVKDDGSAVDDCIYYLPKGKTLKEVGFTVPTLPIGYEKWVDSNLKFTEDTAVEQDLVLTAEKSEQNTYIPVTLMYQNQKEILNILKGNKIDPDAISKATKNWTDDVVGGNLKIESWQTNEGASFDITNKTITEAITLVAVPYKKWTVSFKVEGETVQTIKVYDKDTITLPEELKEKADKWYLEDDEEFSFGTTKITADTTIIGKKNQANAGNEGETGNDNNGTGESGNDNSGTGETGQQPNTSNVSDYAPIFIEPIIESSTAGTATTRTTDNNSVTISDDSTPLSAGEMARIRAILDSYTEIRMKDIEAKGYNKLMKAYTKAVKKIKSRKVTDKEIAELYKKLQENKKKYVKMDCNIKRLNMAVIKGKNKKQLLALIKKLDKYVAAKYKETVFANLFKKYDKAIKALNNETISDRKLDIIYNDLIKEKKDADKSLKK